ncbi:MAG: LOG family protein [Paludibacteraceae bacterium]
MRKIKSQEILLDVVKKGRLDNLAFQMLDLNDVEDQLLQIPVSNCLFLDCAMSDQLNKYLRNENYLFPKLNVPFSIYPSGLYNRDSLYNGYDYNNPESYFSTPDRIVYDYYKKKGGAETRDIKETLARSLHDHSIYDAKRDFLTGYDERKIVAIMGGHKLRRDDGLFLQIAQLAKKLTEKGYLITTGGGPGAMEAAHLGAWLAGKTDSKLQDAVNILSPAPIFSHPDWLKTAFIVLEKYPETNFHSLGIPTWLYGHELSTPFATHIAKLFENSLREEGLLAIAKGGVIFSPGSAGTLQEIFMDLAQNHYESYGFASPMLFLGKKYWTEDYPVFSLIKRLIDAEKLNKIDLNIYDSNENIIHHLMKSNSEGHG